MDRFYEALDRLTSFECQDESVKGMMMKFLADYQKAIEDDHQAEPNADIGEIGADFLDILSANLSDGNRLKQNLSRGDVKNLILGLVQRTNCRMPPCRMGVIASEGVGDLLDKILPAF